jgi:hypothetical protein
MSYVEISEGLQKNVGRSYKILEIVTTQVYGWQPNRVARPRHRRLGRDGLFAERSSRRIRLPGGRCLCSFQAAANRSSTKMPTKTPIKI